MKKIIALVLSLSLACTTFVACGDKDSSSKGSEKKEVAAKKGEFAKSYSDKISKGDFSIDMTITSAYMGEMPCIVVKNGEDYMIETNVMGMDSNVYFVEGVAYVVMPDAEIYTTQTDFDIEDMGINIYQIDDTFEFVEFTEEDGKVIENYTSTVTEDYSEMYEDDVEMEPYTYTTDISYYFDAEGNLEKIVTTDELSGETTVTFNSIKFEADKVELPDLSALTEMSDDEELDPATEMKVTLAMFGVTKEDVEAAGYTYEQIAEISQQDSDQLMVIFEELGVDMSAMLGGLGDMDLSEEDFSDEDITIEE